MHLVGHLCTGPTNHHNGSWRLPDSDADTILNASRYEKLAQIYERGLFDGIFIVDYPVIVDMVHEGSRSSVVERGGQLAMLDPIQVLAVMARVTNHLGLAATLSTSFHHAYSIARIFSTLDHLSNGRAGWNIVTTALELQARNYGQDSLMDKSLRYDHADQVVEACLALWSGWEADALMIDRERGLFADPEKVHFINFNGSMVQSHGAFTTPRSPQGWPVLMQAGASDRGREFAARWAEVIFTVQERMPQMQAFYADMKGRMVEKGRKPSECAILPSIDVIVAETEAAAQSKADYVDSFANIDAGLKVISTAMNVDVLQYPLDTPLSAVRRAEVNVAGLYDNMMALRKDGRELTLREAAMLQATTWWCPRLVGTAAMVVDQMQDLFDSECCDGFIIAQSQSPKGVEDFVQFAVPELQRRGLHRLEYTGRTFRENLRS
jgi:FMN-dependent oxidoreductase (nitrilotriacetate monooxygenase family)